MVRFVYKKEVWKLNILLKWVSELIFKIFKKNKNSETVELSYDEMLKRAYLELDTTEPVVKEIERRTIISLCEEIDDEITTKTKERILDLKV